MRMQILDAIAEKPDIYSVNTNTNFNCSSNFIPFGWYVHISIVISKFQQTLKPSLEVLGVPLRDWLLMHVSQKEKKPADLVMLAATRSYLKVRQENFCLLNFASA